MKYRHTRKLTCLSAFALSALMSLTADAQSSGSTESTQGTETRSTNSAQASTAVYTQDSGRQVSVASPAQGKRKPRWFDERRQPAETAAKTGSFERLSYTRYEGEADLGSGNCVYYQSSYTYSCR